MNKFLSLVAFVSIAIFGMDVSALSQAATEPEPAPKHPTSLRAASSWIIEEGNTSWSGKWVRRGNSSVFDISIHDKFTNENRQREGVVLVSGKVVTVTLPDGTAYQGTLSADETRIDGTQEYRKATGDWIVRLDTNGEPREKLPDNSPRLIDAGGGRTYPNATITKVEPDGLTFVYEAGFVKVFFESLSPDIQAQYGYDPVKAGQYRESVEKAATAYTKQTAPLIKAVEKEKARLEEQTAKKVNAAGKPTGKTSAKKPTPTPTPHGG